MTSTIEHISLSELISGVQATIKNAFENRSFWVLAEISEYKFYKGKDRHYMSLVEKGDAASEIKAKVRAIAWSAGDKNIQNFVNVTGQKFEDGIQILAKVKIEFHAVYGLQLIIIDVDVNFTLGKLAKQREEILQRLVRENKDTIQVADGIYTTKNKLLSFRKVIQRIAVIGSPNSEGFSDFATNMKNNSFGYRFALDIYQSSVQGEQASGEMLNCLIAIFKSGVEYDAVVIIRGGGGKTDFLAFNQYDLARAIARFPIPIITGIGHQGDESICDLMAKVSVNAPTKAAEYIIAYNRRFDDELNLLFKNSIIRVQQKMSAANAATFDLQSKISSRSALLVRNQMNRILAFNNVLIKVPMLMIGNKQKELMSLRGLLLSKPTIVVGTKQGELTNMVSNFKSFSSKYLVNKKGYLGHYEAVIRLMSPENILNRGFALITQNGALLTSGKTLNVGDKIDIRMKDVIIKTTIESKENHDNT